MDQSHNHPFIKFEIDVSIFVNGIAMVNNNY